MLNYKILIVRKHVWKHQKKSSFLLKCEKFGKNGFNDIRVSLSSPKFEKCNFNKMFKVSIGQKHNKNIKVLAWDPKKLTGTW